MSDSRSEFKALYALLTLGVFLALLNVALEAYPRIFSPALDEQLLSKRCMYQVITDGLCMGTFFFDRPQSMRAIIEAAAPASGHITGIEDQEVPCDQAIRIEGRLSLASVEKISGAQLLTVGRPIDLNLADEEDLCVVPRIGPALARRIISLRETLGRFSTVEELQGVKGLGRERILELRAYLTVHPVTPSERSVGHTNSVPESEHHFRSANR